MPNLFLMQYTNLGSESNRKTTAETSAKCFVITSISLLLRSHVMSDVLLTPYVHFDFEILCLTVSGKLVVNLDTHSFVPYALLLTQIMS